MISFRASRAGVAVTKKSVPFKKGARARLLKGFAGNQPTEIKIDLESFPRPMTPGPGYRRGWALS
jgi:hypothetical protein